MFDKMKKSDKTASPQTESQISLLRVFRGKSNYLVVCSTVFIMDSGD